MLPPDLQNAQLGTFWLSQEDGDTLCVLSTVDGWNGSPAPTRSLTQRSHGSGAYASENYAGPRHIALGGSISGKDGAAVKAKIDQLKAAFSLAETKFQALEDGETRWAMVANEDELIITRKTALYAVWSGQVSSTDWRQLGDAMTATTALPSSSGGLTIPLTVPIIIAETTVTGQVSLTNPGNETGPVTLRIEGPVTGPVITHVASGLSLVFSSSLALAAGEWLEVDMEAQTVLANGQASRAGWVVERGWSGFEPGDNTWAFTAASYSADARLTVTATPAWK